MTMTFRQIARMPRFMLDHRWTGAHLSDEIDGELRPEARVRLRRHVDECEECHRMLDSLRQTVSAMRAAAFRAKPGVSDRVIQRLDLENASRERPGNHS